MDDRRDESHDTPSLGVPLAEGVTWGHWLHGGPGTIYAFTTTKEKEKACSLVFLTPSKTLWQKVYSLNSHQLTASSILRPHHIWRRRGQRTDEGPAPGH